MLALNFKRTSKSSQIIFFIFYKNYIDLSKNIHYIKGIIKNLLEPPDKIFYLK